MAVVLLVQGHFEARSGKFGQARNSAQQPIQLVDTLLLAAQSKVELLQRIGWRLLEPIGQLPGDQCLYRVGWQVVPGEIAHGLPLYFEKQTRKLKEAVIRC